MSRVIKEMLPGEVGILPLPYDSNFASAISSLPSSTDVKAFIDNNRNIVHNRQNNGAGYLYRVDSSGNSDSTFVTTQGDGWLYESLSGGEGRTIVQQSDGKILVGGVFYLNSTTYVNLVRLNSDGTMDTSFNTNLGTGGNGYGNRVTSLAVQSDGKILVCGDFYNWNGTGYGPLIRLNSDGTIDSSFSAAVDGKVYNYCYQLALQSDGKILIALGNSDYNGNLVEGLIRLNSDGTEDTSFTANLGTGFNNYTYGVKLQSDGKILVCGDFTTLNGSNVADGLIRLNSDGTVDTSFNANLGTGFGSGGVWKTNVDSNGKIVATGWFSSVNGTSAPNFVRLNATGTIDTTFMTNLGFSFDNETDSVSFDSSNNIYVAGYFTWADTYDSQGIAMINEDGTVNATFAGNTVFNLDDGSRSVLVLSSGSVMFGSQLEFENYNGSRIHPAFVVSSTGVFDSTFESSLSTGFGGFSRSPTLFSIAFESDDDIVVGGDLLSYDGVTINGLCRLDNDGNLDTSFQANLGTGFNVSTEYPYTIAIQSDGKILVGGSFTFFNGNTRNRLIRLNSDGTEDTTFYTNLGTGFNDTIRVVKLQSDGKILVGGAFTTLNGTTRNRFLRLNSDGTVDTSFYTNLGTGFTTASRSIYDIAIQADNDIIVVGNYVNFNGNTKKKIVRLNSDGTEDTTFYTNLGTGFQNDNIPVSNVAVQSDGDIVLEGPFTAFNGNTRNRLIRLNSDGTEDTGFYGAIAPYTNADYTVSSLALDNTDDFIYVTQPSTINSISAYQLVKINMDVSISWTAPSGVTEVMVVPCSSAGVPICNPVTLTVVPNTTYTFTVNSSSYNLSSLNTLGAIYSWTGTSYLQIYWVE